MKNATLKKDIFTILGVSLFLTLLIYVFQMDQHAAATAYEKGSAFAHSVREYSQVPVIVISVFMLFVILIPKARKKFPTLNHTALVWLFTLIFGAGVLVHGLIKETAERPRPRDTVILNGEAPFYPPLGLHGKPEKAFHGKSFPSGHVAMGAMLLVPFFTLRRKKPALAKAFLIAGISYGAFVGYGRMVAGAHFMSDVLWGIACVLLTASFAGHVISEKFQLKSRYTLTLLALTLFGLAWFNGFQRTLKVELNGTEIQNNLPCLDVQVTRTQSTQEQIVTLHLKGFGGPTKGIRLNVEEGKVSLHKGIGIFRDLKCTAHFKVNEETEVNFPAVQ